MSSINFSLSFAEHEQSFIISGLGLILYDPWNIHVVIRSPLQLQNIYMYMLLQVARKPGWCECGLLGGR